MQTLLWWYLSSREQCLLQISKTLNPDLVAAKVLTNTYVDAKVYFVFCWFFLSIRVQHLFDISLANLLNFLNTSVIDVDELTELFILHKDRLEEALAKKRKKGRNRIIAASHKCRQGHPAPDTIQPSWCFYIFQEDRYSSTFIVRYTCPCLASNHLRWSQVKL